jgi:D-alanyl-D-alanine carboxypeptidase/D-alanyl-D-alanine-endopeptidase (penicillin-binding protein 4)
LFLVVAISLFSQKMYAQGQISGNQTNSIQEAIDAFARDPALKQASWGVVVLDALSGNPVAAHQPEILLTPASVLKLVVTFPAWKTLGPSFRFKTYLEADMLPEDDSVVHGNVYLTGYGDPTFASPRLEKANEESVFSRFAYSLIKHGVKRINGTVLGDGTAWKGDFMASQWLWSDIGNYYASGACALNYHENYYTLALQSGSKKGDPARIIEIDPALPGLEFENLVTTAALGTGDQVIIYGAPYDTKRYSRGTVPLDKKPFKVKGSIPDPVLACAQAFHRYLSLKNIEVANQANTIENLSRNGNYINKNRLVLDSIESPPLSEIIGLVHEKSINLYAECLLRKLGETMNFSAEESQGIAAVKKFWEQRNVDLGGFQMHDGCGLSPLNKISCNQLAKMLTIVFRDPERIDFIETMNEAGQSGNLKQLFKGTAADGNLRAKSGYMKGVRSYAGFTTNKTGRNLIFCVIVNNYGCSAQEMKAKLEKLIAAIPESRF